MPARRNRETGRLSFRRTEFSKPTHNTHTNMSNKLSAYIDLAKLQGAHRLRLKGKDGRLQDCIVINLEQARAKVSERDAARVNLSLSLVPNRDGRDDFGQTHWICEPTTKDERERNPGLKLPILGNAREFEDGPPTPRTAAQPAPGTAASGVPTPWLEEDDIPF